MTAEPPAHRLLHQFRQLELEACRTSFAPGMRVLDYGGGTGFQASVLASWGCDVSSIDIEPQPGSAAHFPVQKYDGRRIPYADGTFDVVFSSNVLEHVRDLPGTLAELRRVMKPDGTAIHILPSAVWRFWTSVTHYPFLMKVVLGRQRVTAAGSDADSGAALRQLGLAGALRRALYPNAHGEYPGALSELYYFSRRRWRRVFERHGFTVASAGSNGILYTGHTLLPALSLGQRRSLARVFGSTCHIFTLRR